jgi:hypothetical protein
MSFIRKFNKDPLNHRYIDQLNCVEYIFVGFAGKLSQSKKRKLIRKYAIPRKYKPSIIDTKAATINFGAPTWETQLIARRADKID